MYVDLDELCCATGARVLHRGTRRITFATSIDSRTVVDEGIFVAFVGEHLDAHMFVPAVADHAGLIVCTRSLSDEELSALEERDAHVVEADKGDGEEFLLRLVALWRRFQKCLILAVTGSVGKTTTKEMLKAALANQLRIHATVGNYNNLIGMPLTALNAPDDTEVLIAEMGMNHAHEIERMSNVLRPHGALITNVGTSHIGLLGSREGIAQAKAEICTGLVEYDKDGEQILPVLVQHAGGDFTSYIEAGYVKPRGVVSLLVGREQNGDTTLYARDIALDEEGLASAQVVVAATNTAYALHLHIPGEKMIDNALCALGLLQHFSFDLSRCIAGIEQLRPQNSRLEEKCSPIGVRILDDCYNAAPASMANALDILMQRPCTGKHIAVLGEMGELGDRANEFHALVGAYAAAKGLDCLVVVGDGGAQSMADAARCMGLSEDRILMVSTPSEAVERLTCVLEAGDLILVKGSHAACLDEFVRGVMA